LAAVCGKPLVMQETTAPRLWRVMHELGTRIMRTIRAAAGAKVRIIGMN
jgi:hypothetical protein